MKGSFLAFWQEGSLRTSREVCLPPNGFTAAARDLAAAGFALESTGFVASNWSLSGHVARLGFRALSWGDREVSDPWAITVSNRGSSGETEEGAGVDEVLFRVLADGVLEYLRGSTRRGAGTGLPAADRGPRPADVTRLVGAWVALLRMHELDENGRCALCSRARGGLLRRRLESSQLCSVWQVAVAYFLRRMPDGGR
jgi:hypothetical protein